MIDGERDALLGRYLAGRLSDSEAERFEAYWADHPEITRDLEATARLGAGLADLRRRGELATVVRGAWWSRPLTLLSIAAGVAALAAGVFAWVLAERAPQIPLGGGLGALPRYAAAQLPLGESVSLLRLRAAARADATLVLPADPRAIAIRVLPEQPSPSGTYRVEIAVDGADTSRPAGAATGLPAAEDGFVTAYVDSRALRPGRYRVAVQPADVAAAASVFVLDVRGPEAR